MSCLTFYVPELRHSQISIQFTFLMQISRERSGNRERREIFLENLLLYIWASHGRGGGETWNIIRYIAVIVAGINTYVCWDKEKMSEKQRKRKGKQQRLERRCGERRTGEKKDGIGYDENRRDGEKKG